MNIPYLVLGIAGLIGGLVAVSVGIIRDEQDYWLGGGLVIIFAAYAVADGFGGIA